MNEEDMQTFYAGCALIGILSNRGTLDEASAWAAHNMALYMIDIQEKLKEKKDDK